VDEEAAIAGVEEARNGGISAPVVAAGASGDAADTSADKGEAAASGACARGVSAAASGGGEEGLPTACGEAAGGKIAAALAFGFVVGARAAAGAGAGAEASLLVEPLAARAPPGGGGGGGGGATGGSATISAGLRTMARAPGAPELRAAAVSREAEAKAASTAGAELLGTVR